MVAAPEATTISVVVMTFPPKTSASIVSRRPTDSRPTVTLPFSSSIKLPPSPTDSTSGMEKAVRTPPTSTKFGAWRGNKQRTDISRRSSDINNKHLLIRKSPWLIKALQECSSPHTIRRAACKSPYGKFGSSSRIGERPIILREIEPAVQVEFPHGLAKASDGFTS